MILHADLHISFNFLQNIFLECNPITMGWVWPTWLFCADWHISCNSRQVTLLSTQTGGFSKFLGKGLCEVPKQGALQSPLLKGFTKHPSKRFANPYISSFMKSLGKGLYEAPKKPLYTGNLMKPQYIGGFGKPLYGGGFVHTYTYAYFVPVVLHIWMASWSPTEGDLQSPHTEGICRTPRSFEELCKASQHMVLCEAPFSVRITWSVQICTEKSCFQPHPIGVGSRGKYQKCFS